MAATHDEEVRVVQPSAPDPDGAVSDASGDDNFPHQPRPSEELMDVEMAVIREAVLTTCYSSSSSDISPQSNNATPQTLHGVPPLPAVTEEYTYEDTCRLAMRMGVAAIKYGTTAGGVEKFLSSLMHEFGYYGVFRTTLKEIFCTFQKNPDDLTGSHTHIIACNDGINLHKLGLLSDLATDVKKKSLSPQQAAARLEEIDREPSPWSTRQVAASFFLVGAGLAAVFEGCWLDIILGSVSGGLFFAVQTFFENQREDLQQWLPLTAAFLISTLATAAKAFLPEINVTLVTLSGVAILLPGYGVSLGTAELVTNHILSGMTRLLQGCVILLWLLTGSTLGKRMVDAILAVSPAATQDDPISRAWYALFVPLLFGSVSVVLGNSYSDTPWAILCMFIAYGTSLLASKFMEVNLGTFLSSVAFTVFANVWANKMDRPNTLILTPAFLVKVSGSFGFLGLVRIVEGETYVGVEQFLQMFVIALLITAGMFAGNTIVPCGTIL